MKTPEETKMDDTLIDWSISHWERMRDGTQAEGESPDSFSCPLCRAYLKKSMSFCDGCPVKEASGESHCENSPWPMASMAWLARRRYPAVWKQAAQSEIDFLKSLKKDVV